MFRKALSLKVKHVAARERRRHGVEGKREEEEEEEAGKELYIF